MKKNALFLLILVLAACQGDLPVGTDFGKLSEDNKKLREESRAKDSAINAIFESFNGIQSTLDTIKKREKLLDVSLKNMEQVGAGTHEQIISDIYLIYGLVEKNKKESKALKEKLNTANFRIVQLEKTIELLLTQIDSRDKEIEDLRFKMAVLTSSFDSVSTLLAKAEEYIKENNIKDAFYAIGTKKELIANHVVDKQGGFLGLGKSLKVMNEVSNYFTQINIDSITFIPLQGKEIELLTPHAKSAYVLSKKGNQIDGILIQDAKKFWRTSKILVVQIK